MTGALPIAFVHHCENHPTMTSVLGPIGFIGGRLLAVFGYLGEIVLIIATFLAYLAAGTAKIRPVTFSVLLKQVQFTGLATSPIGNG